MPGCARPMRSPRWPRAGSRSGCPRARPSSSWSTWHPSTRSASAWRRACSAPVLTETVDDAIVRIVMPAGGGVAGQPVCAYLGRAPPVRARRSGRPDRARARPGAGPRRGARRSDRGRRPDPRRSRPRGGCRGRRRAPWRPGPDRARWWPAAAVRRPRGRRSGPARGRRRRRAPHPHARPATGPPGLRRRGTAGSCSPATSTACAARGRSRRPRTRRRGRRPGSGSRVSRRGRPGWPAIPRRTRPVDVLAIPPRPCPDARRPGGRRRVRGGRSRAGGACPTRSPDRGQPRSSSSSPWVSRPGTCGSSRCSPGRRAPTSSSTSCSSCRRSARSSCRLPSSPATRTRPAGPGPCSPGRSCSPSSRAWSSLADPLQVVFETRHATEHRPGRRRAAASGLQRADQCRRRLRARLHGARVGAGTPLRGPIPVMADRLARPCQSRSS